MIIQMHLVIEYAFDDNFDLTNNDYSSDLLFSTTAGDQDNDGITDEITVTLGGNTEGNYDWVFITDGAGNLLYGPVSGPQSGSIPQLTVQSMFILLQIRLLHKDQ